MVRVIRKAVMHSVFGGNRKENSTSAKVVVSRTEYTPKELNVPASKCKFWRCCHGRRRRWCQEPVRPGEALLRPGPWGPARQRLAGM